MSRDHHAIIFNFVDVSGKRARRRVQQGTAANRMSATYASFQQSARAIPKFAGSSPNIGKSGQGSQAGTKIIRGYWPGEHLLPDGNGPSNGRTTLHMPETNHRACTCRKLTIEPAPAARFTTDPNP